MLSNVIFYFRFKIYSSILFYHLTPGNKTPTSTSNARAIFSIVLIFISCFPLMYLRRFSTSKSES